jgi:hypothetical protein
VFGHPVGRGARHGRQVQGPERDRDAGVVVVRHRALGLPVACEGVSLCAVSIAMSEEALRETRAAYGMPCSRQCSIMPAETMPAARDSGRSSR